MASIATIMGVTHSPPLPKLIAADVPAYREVAAAFADMRRRLAAAKPDLILVLGCDHLNQFFMNNMPAFLIGKAPSSLGPFGHEQDRAGMPSYDVAIDQRAARIIIEEGFTQNVDFAFADECVIDHSFTVPLCLLRPEADLPIVPVFSNVMAPPFPPAARFHRVGQALRAVVDRLPAERRVAVLASGHLSTEVGGPRLRAGLSADRPDPAFDKAAMKMFGDGDTDGLLRLATVERMAAAGNVTSAFLNFVMLMGFAGDRPADQSEEIIGSPFLTWQPESAQ
jgi:protocatechuate 4,5-dioxygenase beta chain